MANRDGLATRALQPHVGRRRRIPTDMARAYLVPVAAFGARLVD